MKTLLLGFAAALTPGVVPTASATPEIPDIGGYQIVSPESFLVKTVLIRHSAPQPVVTFKTSSGAHCVILLNHTASCNLPGVGGASLRGSDAGEIAAGGAYTVPDLIEYSSYLQPRQSILADHEWDPDRPNQPLAEDQDTQFAEDPITCGVLDDGSVSCQSGKGHGFVLSRSGSDAW